MNKQDKYDDIFDHMLKYAAEQSMEDMANDCPVDNELDQQPSYSPEFESRMTNYFKKVKTKGQAYRISRVAIKVAVFALVFIGVSTSVIYNVEAFRVPFLNLFSESGEVSTTIKVRDEKADYSSIRDKISGLDLPTFIPENYFVDSLDRTDKIYSIMYKNVDGEVILFNSLSDSSTVVIDNEDIITKEISVNDESAKYYEKNDMRLLLFKYRGNYFMMTGTISENELFQIAESMERYP